MNSRTLTLRPYQQQAVSSVLDARRRGLSRVVLALPTGAGKTVIFSELARLARGRVLVLVHRQELLAQARSKLALARGVDVEAIGIEMATQRAEASHRCVVASIRSLASDRILRLLSQSEFSLVIYDECHHATATDNMRVLEELGVLSPSYSGILVGVTATTRRADGDALSRVFQEIVFSKSLTEMIAEGYLRPLRGFTISTGTDLNRAIGNASSSEREDLSLDDDVVADAIDVEGRNALVARSIQELARDRRTIAFCVTVRHAENLARALNYFGVRAGMICGEMPADARRATLEAFASGRLSVLTNVGVLTEGFDDPGVSAVAMVRPTRSESLYVQCVGRGMRLSPAAKDCLVLDFVDVCRLDLVTLPSLAGLPRRTNLQGELVHEAVETIGRPMDWLDEIVEDEDISLSEVQRRAQLFDPLSQSVHADVPAISPCDWFSLGKRGVALYVCAMPRASAKSARHGSSDVSTYYPELRAHGLTKIEVLHQERPRRGYVVWIDGVEQARFSRLHDAIEAVDFELQRRGTKYWESALPQAAWRQQKVPEPLQKKLAQFSGVSVALTLPDALRQLHWFEIHRPWRRGQRSV